MAHRALYSMWCATLGFHRSAELLTSISCCIGSGCILIAQTSVTSLMHSAQECTQSRQYRLMPIASDFEFALGHEAVFDVQKA